MKTEANLKKISEELSRIGRSVNSQKQELNFNMNILNQFVENGYEVHQEWIDLNEWWLEENNSRMVKIFFNKDYSSKPQVFYTLSALDQFHISERIDKVGIQDILLSVELAEIMTSYFTVKLKIEKNEITPSNDMKNYHPRIELSYVLLNKKSD